MRSRGTGFGAEVKRRIMLGTYALSEGYADAYYRQAQKVRTMIKGEFDGCSRACDALVAPVSPIVAFKLGQKLDDPYAMYLCDVCTLPANIAGIPGISVPCGMLDGLPVGLQVLAPAFGEEMALRVGLRLRAERALRRGEPGAVIRQRYPHAARTHFAPNRCVRSRRATAPHRGEASALGRTPGDGLRVGGHWRMRRALGREGTA